MTLVPSLADSSDHFINHCGTVSSLGNAGRGTGSIRTGNNGVVDILTVGDAGSGQSEIRRCLLEHDYLDAKIEEQMKEVKANLNGINSFREKQLKAARFILYNTWQAEEDKQGRILLPENLRKYARIEKNIIVFQGPTCIEIWSEEVWNEYFNDVNFEELADALDLLNENV